MSKIGDRIADILAKNDEHQFSLIAVSKTKPMSEIQEAYDAGHRQFGENKVQELVDKYEELPKDIEWHMIGHLQRNKVKYLAPFVHLIHGVDSLRLLKQINKEGEKIDRTIPCLLQIHIAKEETKFGFDKDEIDALITEKVLEEMPYVTVKGLMGMATNTTDMEVVKQEFTSLRSLYNELQPILDLDTLSMGMSGDYQLALACGSNMIRVGSAIFGQRNYAK
ncbi:MAG: YggS family pyridoxal phosphate-dependent enzyme [Bacteroidota bacterium]